MRCRDALRIGIPGVEKSTPYEKKPMNGQQPRTTHRNLAAAAYQTPGDSPLPNPLQS